MKNGNRPAHPLNGEKWQKQIDNGVSGEYFAGPTKREYFAAMAMQGILANPTETLENKSLLQSKLINSSLETVCKQSIKYADELLKQLGS
jgi:hypothetical protein